MMAHRYDQFVFLIADDEPMRGAAGSTTSASRWPRSKSCVTLHERASAYRRAR